jgi:hypothetical protein
MTMNESAKNDPGTVQQRVGWNVESHRDVRHAVLGLADVLDLINAACSEINTELRARLIIHKAANLLIDRFGDVSLHVRTVIESLGFGVRDESEPLDHRLDIVSKREAVPDKAQDGQILRMEAAGVYALDGSCVLRHRTVVVGRWNA